MQLNSLSVSRFRNLRAVSLELGPTFNLFYGENGSGKTSLLEAIHVLATGRSFKTREFKQAIAFDSDSCVVSGVSTERQDPNAPIPIGIERFQQGGLKIRLLGEDCSSVATLAKVLPIQLVNSDSYSILEASPQLRRNFLNWIMFHVEHSFYSIWQRYTRALQQRNAALKNSQWDSLQAWDIELVETGEKIDELRKVFVRELEPVFSETVSRLLNLKGEVVLRYQSGWSAKYSLQEALNRSRDRDKAFGYTGAGPHRGDLDFLLDGIPVKQVLSRGQLKLFVCSLLLARAEMLNRHQGRKCVFLIDDLCSELDVRATRVLLEELATFGAQVLITCIERNPVSDFLGGTERCFNVVAGEIYSEECAVL